MGNNFTEADYHDLPRLWVRVGDSGEYENYGDDLAALIDYLNDLSAGEVTGWVDGGMGIGVETVNYHGYDFISLYWGDADANPIRHLNEEERQVVAERLEEAFI